MNRNLKQKNDSDSNFYNFSLLVPYPSEFLAGSLYLYPYVLWYILPPPTNIFYGGLIFFPCLVAKGLGRFQMSSIKPSMINHVNSRAVDGNIICFRCACQLFTLLLGNFLFENFLSVQVCIETLKKVFTTVW